MEGNTISKINIKVEGNSNFKIAISFHSSIFGKNSKKMEWKEIATPYFRYISFRFGLKIRDFVTKCQ